MFLLSFESYLKFENSTIKYFESPEGLKASMQEDAYYDTFLKDFQFRSGLKPTFNPWQYCTFKTGKKPRDVYSIWGKIGKGFFVSSRFKEFLSNYKIAEHVIFDGIKYFHGIEYRDDMRWIAF